MGVDNYSTTVKDPVQKINGQNQHTDYPQGKNYGKIAYCLALSQLSTEKAVLIRIFLK